MLFTTPSASPLAPATRHQSQLPAVRSIERRHVISEELFHDALVRERKRADRFEEAFALVMITLDRRRAGRAGGGAACRVDVAIATRRRRDWLARAGFRAGSHSIDPGARTRRHRHDARQRLPPRAGAMPARRSGKLLFGSLRNLLVTQRRRRSRHSRSGQRSATGRDRWRGWRRSAPWISPAAPRVSSLSAPCSCAPPPR